MTGSFTASRDPDVALALLYVPGRARPAVAALFALDARMAAVVARTREPMLAAIRLAWWRERIEALAAGGAVPEEPLLRSLAEHKVAGAGALIEAWEQVLDGEAIAGHTARGMALFAAAAGVLMPGSEARFAQAGAVWALADAARHGAPTLDTARARAVPIRWPAVLRPLGMLALLAMRDARAAVLPPQGTPGRAGRMAWHRLTGR